MKKVKGTRSIKECSAGGYQIQMWVNNVSHSDFAKDLPTAIKKRDALYAKHNRIVGVSNLKTSNVVEKKYYKPFTDVELPVGISMGCYYDEPKGRFYFSFTVSYVADSNKSFMRSFYVGNEDTITKEKFVKRYNRALHMRMCFEKMYNHNPRKDFDPKHFGVNALPYEVVEKELMLMSDDMVHLPLVDHIDNSKWWHDFKDKVINGGKKEEVISNVSESKMFKNLSKM